MTPPFCTALLALHLGAAPSSTGAGSGPAGAGGPLEVCALDATTYVLREPLAVTWEAPFLYLLIGSERALLLDTGDVADDAVMPVARTVLDLLPSAGAGKLPLLVVHSHGHLDHRAGDGQFAGVRGVELVPARVDALVARFGFSHWPAGTVSVDLGQRIVEVLPAPGHHAAELVFYDQNTALVFSGDFLLPGRILVDDREAYAASARHIADFVRNVPVRAVLGGHIEKDIHGELFDWQAPQHPDEASLALPEADLLALPTALDAFNGFYATHGSLVLVSPIHLLWVAAFGALVVVGALAWLAVRVIRRWRHRRQRASSAA
jgi:glyoxylase-like metal-dependent hydrolase (beta-lactamase superfamily II)